MEMDRRKKLKILLIEKDIVLSQIARDLGVTHGAVTNVLRGVWASRRILEAVAARVGMDPDVFRDTYIPVYRRVA